ncbi:28880_t:CDS:1, partial [Gigaspora margarita]
MINNSWYKEIEKEIMMKEFKKTIKEAPTRKTTGLQAVLNEMIKRTGKK